MLFRSVSAQATAVPAAPKVPPTQAPIPSPLPPPTTEPTVPSLPTSTVIPTLVPTDTSQTEFVLTGKFDAQAVLKEDVEIRSADELLTLLLPAGVQALTADNLPLNRVTAKAVDLETPPNDGRVPVSLGYQLGPSGANFDTPVPVTLNYDPERLPEGVNADALVVAYFDPDTEQWIELVSQIDQQAHTVSAEIQHFSVYAILGKPRSFNWVTLGISTGVASLAMLALLLFVLRQHPLSSQSVAYPRTTPRIVPHSRPRYVARGKPKRPR